ncbi:MAG TPA: SdiA-regulated domain-containing protein [Rubricoccaceae bacterium]
MHRLLALPVLASLFAATCSAPADGSPDDAPGAARVSEAPAATRPNVPYALAAPSATVELPDEIREISGLTVFEDGTLGAVQDEIGTLYTLSAATGEIVGREVFKERGDFEGVERVGDDVWVLRSDGDLYRIRRSAASVEAERFQTDLAGRNDTEGLAYDEAGNRLLIACKENPGSGLQDVRAIYAFSLATNTLSPAPVFTLDRRLVDTSDAFKPSALAVRPRTGELYVLSSVRKAVAVLARDGSLQTVISLPEALFAQPEGLAFAPDGTLYISNEGPNGPATLLRFDPTDR